MSFRPVSSSASVAFAALALLNAQPSRAEDAASIIKKTTDRYLNAKTFWGVILTHQSLTGANGKPATVDATQTIFVQMPGKFHFDVAAKGTGDGANASKDDHSMVCDGKTLFAYYSGPKQYIKNPAPPGFSMKQIVASLLPQLDRFAPSGLTTGATTFTVLMKMQMPKNLPPQVTPEQKKQIEERIRKAQPVMVIVNKRDYSLAEVKVSGDGGKSLHITVLEQSFDKPLPAGAFQFTPPAGAKLITPPQTGGKP